MKTTDKTISTAMRIIAEGDVMQGRLDAYLYNTSPTYKEEWERCNLIDLQVFIEVERGMKPNETLYNVDATYTKIRNQRDFESFKQDFERKYL